ncbi:hypothetical protein TI03_04015, partial [Achromatium sp. WMS1]
MQSTDQFLEQQVNIIFLDIDGVLRPDVSVVYATMGKAYEAFSPIAVGLLNRLCYETNAELVISSSWRLTHDAGYILNHLQQSLAALNLLIPDTNEPISCYMKIFYREPDIEKSWCTPLSNDLFNRSNEIDTWLHTWGHWVKGY